MGNWYQNTLRVRAIEEVPNCQSKREFITISSKVKIVVFCFVIVYTLITLWSMSGHKELFISSKNCKTYKYTVKCSKCMLVLVCGEKQIKQVRNYKWL